MRELFNLNVRAHEHNWLKTRLGSFRYSFTFFFYSFYLLLKLFQEGEGFILRDLQNTVL